MFSWRRTRDFPDDRVHVYASGREEDSESKREENF